MDELSVKWSPADTICKILKDIDNTMKNPDPNNALDSSIAA
jgi:ubiquitin-protein ligase